MATKTLFFPDLGTNDAVTVIALAATAGSAVQKENTLATLESDKATMDIPATEAGKISQWLVKIGDKVKTGDPILKLESVASENTAAAPAPQKEAAPEKTGAVVSAPVSQKPAAKAEPEIEEESDDGDIHAGPSVRRISREFGVDLNLVSGSGEKGRIIKEDVQAFVKARLSGSTGSAGFNLPAAPEIDFSAFGPISTQPLSKIKKLTGQYTHQAWVRIPHVTQFDEADITELEAFRVAQNKLLTKENIKLTPIVFLIKALVAALKKFPQFNSSLQPNGENLILKNYFHIGVAVDTPEGLVVPVIKDADQKNLVMLAKELAELSEKARQKKLLPREMQGGSMTISSLGGIGGTAFTPIVNAPEVAILGVSKSAMKPVFIDGDFEPRLMLPLSLSYDHRVIDGAEAACFSAFFAACLTDLRLLLL